ncbi:Carboxypeptidase regulatory-like domain-containing protein [Granulicella rosea]|uniref:Carboxypeptidase regulatory-like domain-containing protein n=1 Tax=Granulicella rosea TaxID=474952 RepID=A0A239DXH1_9BACT|nr:carboxypeptidase regulatory-like domain-containing protein [Granulicella rosea]SNS37150.1 Carboxypeptidase regulatory-like domain-containing protein [Granulicella rosea]
MKLQATAISLAFTAALQAQQPACGKLSGQVLDATGAIVVGATVRIDAAMAIRTDAQGRFTTGCLSGEKHRITVTFEGFEPTTVRAVAGAETAIHLKPLSVKTEIDVTEGSGVDSDDVAGSKTLQKEDLKQLADDPDEFARELQVLAAAAGGAPGAATIAVDGFQNGGRIPPKSSIAYIRVNPDLFSSEYERPPYQGGRIEIYTKPGQDKLHGALFTTQSASFMNAADPFSTSKAAIGKQRYGFELSGPIKPKKADFAVALEHRQIDQFAVVNAVLGDGSQYIANVATPKALWSGSLRFGWLLTPKNNFTGTYTAGVNELGNLGVGGNTLESAGYGSVQSEHALRFTNLQTITPRLLHESRVGYTWRYRDDTPNSTAPSLQVAGYFTSGGIVTGALHAHERDLEVDDDILFSTKKHNFKLGIEALDLRLSDSLPTNFNGSTLYGGSATQTALQQYQAGAATTFTQTTGTAATTLNQLRVVLYGQDQWKLRPRLSLSLGLRYAMESAPVSLNNIAPRVGLAWSPDKKQAWVFHLRSGLFFSPVDTADTLEARRLDGTHQIQRVTYYPGTIGAATVATVRQLAPGSGQNPSWQSHLGVEHDLKGHWHVQANFYLARAWNDYRSRNINAPTDGTLTGPRPFGPALNIDQYQQTGHLKGNVIFLGVDQHSLKRLQIFAGYIRMDLRSDTDGDGSFPQNNTDQGETARPTWQNTHHVIAFGNLVLPRKVNLSTQFDANSGPAYNITTGFDNNNDGVFNDRPHYATAADTLVYHTRFGALSPTGTGPTINRNAGAMPWNIHMDVNLSRTFPLTKKADGQTLALNLRSTNVLNHNNVTSVGGVLGSPYLGQGYASDPGRRVEAGLRYAF